MRPESDAEVAARLVVHGDDEVERHRAEHRQQHPPGLDDRDINLLSVSVDVVF